MTDATQAFKMVAAIASCSLGIVGQVPTILFTGQHPFVSRDAGNERPGGAINQLTEYGFSYAIPGVGIARTLMPATAMQCYFGDGDLDGNYLKLRGWKNSYFDAIGIGGVFVRDADRNSVTWDKVFFTVRLESAPGSHELEALVGGGIPYLMSSGDWLRFGPNGDFEFFLVVGQLATAAGVQSSSTRVGASALLQAANGDLYYAPSDGGHWVNGNTSGTAFAEDGAICKIDAANIVYDAAGNVATFAPGSARLLINESTNGLGGTPTLLDVVAHCGAMDRTGNPLAASVYGKTVGLAFDPNGGTWLPSYPDGSGNLPAEPNLLWCSEASSYAGTLFSTSNGGEVAVLNGATCGSTTPGVPADGAWLGVRLDLANDQPSLLGFTLIDIPSPTLIADQNDFGALGNSATEPAWLIDFFGVPGQAVLGLVDIGPAPPLLTVPSLAIGLLPLAFTNDSWSDVFLTAPITFGAGVTDAFGYLTLSTPNPNNGALSGFTIVAQGVALAAGSLQLSSPVIVQLQ